MLYHCSPVEIKKITDNGRFGRFLFFGRNASHWGDFVYEIDEDYLNIVKASRLGYERWEAIAPFVERIQKLIGCDAGQAVDLLDQSTSTGNAESDWDIQRITAECAVSLGYDGVAVPDEYGTSYMIDMKNRSMKLIKRPN